MLDTHIQGTLKATGTLIQILGISGEEVLIRTHDNRSFVIQANEVSSPTRLCSICGAVCQTIDSSVAIGLCEHEARVLLDV